MRGSLCMAVPTAVRAELLDLGAPKADCERPVMPKSGRCRAVTDDAVVVYRGWYG